MPQALHRPRDLPNLPPAADHDRPRHRLPRRLTNIGASNASTKPCKRWLAAQPAAGHHRPSCRPSSTGSATQYNQHRPHRSLAPAHPGRGLHRHPQSGTRATTARPSHYRLRYDRIDNNGKISLRQAGRMHHLGIGAHQRTPRILAIVDETTVTVIHLTTGEIIAPTPSTPPQLRRNQQKAPADGQGVTNDPTHL